MTTMASESSINARVAASYSGAGSFSTVCMVVTTGFSTARSSSVRCAPAGPPKMPYSCWTETTLVPEALIHSAARR